MQRFGRLIGVSVALALALPLAAPATAGSLYEVPKYAAILLNSDTGEVLYARKADEQRFPASITKVMSIYVAFEEMKAGRLKDSDRITISKYAAGQPPTKLGLKPGQTISVNDAIGVMATRSANDISVALAEHIAGSEGAFAARMTATARRLGMMNSQFRNPHGLPNAQHFTTARDIAMLSRALVRDFPDRYFVFSKVEHQYEGQMIASHNHLLKTVPGVDGIKTGFTNAAGFTLAASAAHDGVRLIAVVLGGPNRMMRDGNVSELLETGFQVLTRRSRGEATTVAANFAEPDDLSDAVMERLAGEAPASDGLVLNTGTPTRLAR
ncbi:D-alanyl-D-alanine carboxypeptidase [Polymorphobacter multimanifer]|uniref:D-alanyl-D-alanine carboxypeptidase n=1 Tax=Polymorphobacter multimanifer TaxID=1070431 RepID=A0A841LAR9_9SPHN|nr:D-alanyl-D-alanine carboxypeptidase family protein [Polymorphobacter multimanifer]MBB6226252.1 D-alanyl-D-alanine carboxypeptidase [Polymorphobacter multimanifer]